jgi:hypothetical protein
VPSRCVCSDEMLTSVFQCAGVTLKDTLKVKIEEYSGRPMKAYFHVNNYLFCKSMMMKTTKILTIIIIIIIIILLLS